MDDSKRTLVEELRYWSGEYDAPSGLMDVAANRIEELEREIARLNDLRARRGRDASPYDLSTGEKGFRK